MMNNSGIKRVYFLDGMRGWAALIVVLCHLYQSWLYMPGVYPYSDFFYKSPLRLSVDGASAVALFFLLSGFALSYPYFMNHEQKALITAARFRYFRLTIPIFFSVLLSYLVISFGLNYSRQTNMGVYMTDLNLLAVIKYSFYKVFYASVTQHYDYGPQLWTLSIEFMGSLMVFAYLALFGNWNYRYFFNILLIGILYKTYLYYGLFMVGVLLSDLYCSKQELVALINRYLQKRTIKNKTGGFGFYRQWHKLQQSKYIFDLSMGMIFLILYQFFMVMQGQAKPFFPISFFVVWVILSPNWQKHFSANLSRFLGRISFSLYLTHFIVLCSLPRYLYQQLINASFSIKTTSLVVSLVAIPMSLLLAYIFTLGIEESLLKKFKAFLIMKGILEKSKTVAAAFNPEQDKHALEFQLVPGPLK